MLQMPQVQKMFRMLDADGDGVLNKAEYQKYLQAIERWEAGKGTVDPDTRYIWKSETLSAWDSGGWADELSRLQTTADRGVDLRAFVLIYTKYRKSKYYDSISEDLDKCRLPEMVGAAGTLGGWSRIHACIFIGASRRL